MGEIKERVGEAGVSFISRFLQFLHLTMSVVRPTLASPGQRAHRFEFLDHPGDVKLRAWGRDLEELFSHAAEGMMTFLFGSVVANFQPCQMETVEIEAPDREALLVDWLSELLYRATSEYHAYIGFRINKLTETELNATVAAAAAEAIEDIKAVTHHELSICQHERGWEATVVFDT